MKLLSIFFKLKKIWDSWDLRSFLLLSFTFQCILIMTASMRKRTSKRLLLGFICLAYLLADWASYYAIGLIPTSAQEVDKYSDLHAFWAPFFLLHLGGPNTITGFSVEDNELWKRSVLHFFVQTGMTLFIVYRALPRNPLLGPTLLMFVAASTRYLERVLALYYASMEKFRRSIAKSSNTTLSSLPIQRPNQRSTQQSKNIEVQMVNDSYILFQTYKGIFGSLSIKFDHNLSHAKSYLLESLKPNEAFNEMEIQMNLAYDIFYTKMWLIIEQKIDEPRMVGPEGVGIKTIMFEERCEHLKKIFERPPARLGDVEKELKSVKSARGDTTMRRSMLNYAHYIKDHLMHLEQQTAKDIIEDIWVELLCHVAIKCTAWAHLEQLSSGGELLTIAWLLMTYVGLTTNFEPQEDSNNNNHGHRV